MLVNTSRTLGTFGSHVILTKLQASFGILSLNQACDVILWVNESSFEIRLMAQPEPEPFTRILVAALPAGAVSWDN